MASPEDPLLAFNSTAARELALRAFGLAGDAASLAGERDQNFEIRSTSTHAVLKFTAAGASRERLLAQHALLVHLAEHAPDLPVPRVLRAVDGSELVEVDGAAGRRHWARALTWLPGRRLVDVHPRDPELLEGLGNLLGRLDRALQHCALPATPADCPWHPLHAERTISQHLHAVTDPDRRGLLDSFLTGFGEQTTAALAALPCQVIHSDANDHNVLVVEGPDGQRVSGLIDFGDAVTAPRIAELANAIAYGAMAAKHPLRTAALLVRGYHRANPLTADELPLLLDLVRARLAVSVTLSAHRRTTEPHNAYLFVSEAPAWQLLEALQHTTQSWALAHFRHACGLQPFPQQQHVAQWLTDHPPDQETVAGTFSPLDLSVGSLDLRPHGPEQALAAIDDHLAASTCAGALLAGGYGEARLVYATPAFAGRTIHLGTDLFAPAGTAVHAPYDATVVSVRDNGALLDYGPTVLLRHAPAPGVTFFTLYGHLARTSVEHLQPAQTIAAGASFAAIGTREENGGWFPHLHFQVVLDLLETTGNFPGVAPPEERELWLALCPDPDLILRLSAAAMVSPREAPAAVLQARRTHLSPTLSLAYRHPLHIVRGYLQHLFAADGSAYLDAVNNVPHVGHCHPRVGAAASRQLATLNTNTRYLHSLLAAYAQRLAALLPAPLEVVFLVCSGSEANELALGIARAHTGGKEFVVLDGAYHGNTGALVELSPYKFDGPGGDGCPPHVQVAPTPDPYRGRHRGPAGGPAYAAEVAEALARATRPAAFLAEPLLGCAGQIVPPAGFLSAAFDAARAAGALCIADEVQVGFGRVGSHMWAFEAMGAVPDIVTLGKPIGNGHPLAAVVTTRAIAASFDRGMEYFNTFGGNPVSCAIGMAVLDVLEQEDLLANARTVGARLLDGLRAVQGRHRLVGDVRGRGLYVGVELVRDRDTLEPADWEAARVVERMKEEGVLVSTDGPLHNVIKIKPPMVFTAADGDQLVATLDAVLGESMFER